MANPSFAQCCDSLSTTLRHRIKERIPAANISRKQMLNPNSIPQVNGVGVAWSTAVCLVGTRRQHCTKNTVLHMKHWHVLVDDHLETTGISGGNQIEQLLAITVIGNRQPLEPTFQKECCRNRVGDIE